MANIDDLDLTIKQTADAIDTLMADITEMHKQLKVSGLFWISVKHS